MSDTLDDFFARKDKKKEKKKKYKIEIVEPEITDELDNLVDEKDEFSKQHDIDPEWIEEKTFDVDFSALQFDEEDIQNNENIIQEEIPIENFDEDDKKQKNLGWKVSNSNEIVITNGVHKDEPIKDTSYVPPAMRQIKPRKGFVNNSEEFPTLNLKSSK